MKSNNRSIELDALATFVAAVVMMGMAMHWVSNQKSAASATPAAEVKTLQADGTAPPPPLGPPHVIPTNS